MARSSGWLSSSITTLSGPECDHRAVGADVVVVLHAHALEAGLGGADRVGEDRLGNAAIQRSFTGGLKIAALLEIANRLEPSYGVRRPRARSNSSISGRAIASPVMKISCTLSRSMISQVRSGSNFGSRIVRCPANRCISRPAWAPPCISGLSGKVTIRGSVGLLGLVELRQRLAGVEVDAAAEHAPEVLVAPHHALGEAGGAAGVDDVDVVGAALAEVALGALAGDRVVVEDPAERPSRRTGRRGRARRRPPRPCAACRAWAQHRGDQRRVGALEDDRDDVGVVEEVVELPLDVAVVHVDRDRADLDDRQHRDDVLDAVLGVDRDVVAGLHPLRLQVVREAVGLGLQLGVGHDPVTDLDGGVVGRRVDGVFEEVSDVVSHAARLEHVLVLG